MTRMRPFTSSFNFNFNFNSSFDSIDNSFLYSGTDLMYTIDTNFDETDEISLNKKLYNSIFKHHYNFKKILYDCDGLVRSPGAVTDVLKKTFSLVLSPKEMGCLIVNFMTPDGRNIKLGALIIHIFRNYRRYHEDLRRRELGL